MAFSHYNDAGRVVLRAAHARDLVPARSLLASLGLPVEGLEDQFGDGYVVAEAGGRLVGVGGVEVYGRSGLVRSVAVDAARQGGAIGRSIVEDRIAWAGRRGLTALYLLTETAPGFFERLGFRRVTREALPAPVRASKEFAEVCPESAVAMALDLRGRASNTTPTGGVTMP